ncbi:MAG: SurA N-terminal domain-containing protein [Kiritimatiellae bacterium]|nr:SurA N-terminal domain-containing protein [Kiritimatiellia bacterium]
MAMMIAKFHRLIQSRLLWGAFLVIIVFTFVIWGMQTPKQARAALEKVSPGKLDGKWVPPEEYRAAFFNSYLSLMLMLGQPIDASKAEKELREAAWRRIATLRAARKLGASASDREVVATIQHHPGFVQQGRFSQVHYNAFIMNMLAPLGISEPAFEEHVREEIMIQKVRNVLDQTMLISPYEVQRAFSTITDTFTIEFVEITTNEVRGEVKLAEDDVKARFYRDPSAFTLPEHVRVKYVRFPVADHLAEVSVSEDDALEYYNDHLEDYSEEVVATNDETQAEAETELSESVPPQTKTVTQPFEDVKAGIVEQLTIEAARRKAADLATDLVVELAPDREGQAPAFDEAIAKFDLQAETLPPFALTEELADIDAGPAFNRAAFALAKNPEDYFSDAVPGTNYVYVIALEEHIAARVPEFEEVAEDVRLIAQAEALEQALIDKAQAVREAALKAVADGKTLADAVKPFGLKTKRLEDFTAASDLEDEPYAPLLLRAVLVRNQGELTEPIPTRESLLLAHVEKREAGDVATYASLRPQIVQTLRRERQRALFDEWQSYLLEKAAFEERKLEPEPEDEIEDEEPYPEERAPDVNDL